MVAVRVGLLVVYVGGTALLNRYLRQHLPTSRSAPSFGGPAGNALVWIWGPTLWVIPGLLWLGILELPPVHIGLLSFVLPLSCYALFLWRHKIVPVLGLAFVLVTALGVLAYALLTPGLSYARLGLCSVSLVMPPLFSIWLLSTWAPMVVPLAPGTEGRSREALAMVLGFFTAVPKPTWVVEEGLVHTRIEGNPWAGTGSGLLITEPENVVILKSGSQIGRVVGPGAALTGPGESPYRVVDLRNQVRTTSVDAITRDGIEVRVPFSVYFRVSRGHRQIRLNEPWPYRNQRDVLQILFAEEVDPTGRSPLDANVPQPWEDLPTKVASHKLEQAISFYSLEQLYDGIAGGVPSGDASGETNVDGQGELLKAHRRLEAALVLPPARELGDALTRATIGKLVWRSVRQNLASRGFDVFDGNIGGSIEPLNRGVIEQNVEAWKSRFIIKVMDWHAAVERKRFSALERIRQEAREKLLVEMVEEASRRIHATGDTTQRDLVAYYMLSSLIRIAGAPEVQRLLPESALPTLRHLYEQIGGPSDLEEES